MKIICVDDNRLGLSSLHRRTRTAVPDAEIILCRSPDEAMKQAKVQGCDVLLTEIGVGRSNVSGILLARQIKEVNPRVNIIFITVCSIHEHAAQILPLKISGYITKPYPQEQLAEEFAHLRYPVHTA